MLLGRSTSFCTALRLLSRMASRRRPVLGSVNPARSYTPDQTAPLSSVLRGFTSPLLLSASPMTLLRLANAYPPRVKMPLATPLAAHPVLTSDCSWLGEYPTTLPADSLNRWTLSAP